MTGPLMVRMRGIYEQIVVSTIVTVTMVKV